MTVAVLTAVSEVDDAVGSEDDDAKALRVIELPTHFFLEALGHGVDRSVRPAHVRVEEPRRAPRVGGAAGPDRVARADVDNALHRVGVARAVEDVPEALAVDAPGVGVRRRAREVRRRVHHRVTCLLYTSPSPRDATLSRMPSSA